MQNFKLICSAQWDAKQGIHPSDSDVYRSISDNKCYKFYPNISQDDLMQYHSLHFMSWKKWTHELKNKIIFSSSQLFWNVSWNHRFEISRIEFWTLNLWKNVSIVSDITTKQSVLISQLSYIEGISLRDLFFLCENQEQFLFIQEILFIMNTYYQNLFWFNMSHISDLEWDLNRIQLQWINIKITGYKEWVLYLTITDIAKNISEFVMNNRGIVQKILETKKSS